MHRTKLKVRFGELDPYNHVNHSVYVAWLEAGRAEALESIGLPLHRMAELGFQIVVTDLNVRYRVPATAGDEVEVRTWVSEIGGARSTWTQEIYRLANASGPDGNRSDANRSDRNGLDDESVLLCSGEVRAGSTDLNGRPTRVPPALRDALENLRA